MVFTKAFFTQEFVSSIQHIKPDDEEFENISVKQLATNNEATTFAIWIKKKVKLHKHIYHTENVIIEEGEGDFQLGDSVYQVKKGDVIVIPQDTWHGVIVNSKETMKVISVQSPQFLGKDRIFKNE
tara:strand:+ start:47 stop:424 length:378 start_codon:yes stop_codon:yes gene_type:complete